MTNTPGVTHQEQKKGNILEYRKNANNISKKQRYALITRGVRLTNASNGYIQKLMDANAKPCIPKSVVTFPTSCSDIPGPIVNLSYDKSLPNILLKRRTVYPGSGSEKKNKPYQYANTINELIGKLTSLQKQKDLFVSQLKSLNPPLNPFSHLAAATFSDDSKLLQIQADIDSTNAQIEAIKAQIASLSRTSP